MVDEQPLPKARRRRAKGLKSQEVQGEPPEIPVVKVYGDFTDQITVVANTMMSVMLGVGRLKDTDEAVLLPYVETKLGGGNPDDLESGEMKTILTLMLTLENAAYLVANLANDLSLTCRDLSKMSTGQFGLERARLEHTRYFAMYAARESITCVRQLTELLDDHPTVPEGGVEEPTDASDMRVKKAPGRNARPE